MRCFKCGAFPVFIVEVWVDHTIEFEVNKDKRIAEEGVLAMGRPDHLEAVCDCGHQWRLRKVFQITELKEKYGTFE